MGLRARWSKLGREYLDRSKVVQVEAPPVVAWGRLFVEFHGVSNGLVLDVGSGTGLYSGVPSEESEYCYYGGDKVSLDPFICLPVKGGVIGLGEFLPFGDCVFDVVFCVSALNHMIDHEGCIGEMYRVLKWGGSCFVGAESNRGDDINHFWSPSTYELMVAFSPPFEIKRFRFGSCMCMLELVKLVS